jgi:hypothetical protein
MPSVSGDLGVAFSLGKEQPALGSGLFSDIYIQVGGKNDTASSLLVSVRL